MDHTTRSDQKQHPDDEIALVSKFMLRKALLNATYVSYDEFLTAAAILRTTGIDPIPQQYSLSKNPDGKDAWAWSFSPVVALHIKAQADGTGHRPHAHPPRRGPRQR